MAAALVTMHTMAAALVTMHIMAAALVTMHMMAAALVTMHTMAAALVTMHTRGLVFAQNGGVVAKDLEGRNEKAFEMCVAEMKVELQVPAKHQTQQQSTAPC